MGQTVVATANVQGSLGPGAARGVLTQVLDHAPHLVGLQEWGLSRLGLLRSTGTVRVVPGPGGRSGRSVPGGSDGYLWCTPLVGGCAVGARADRFEQLAARAVPLSRPGRGDRPGSFMGLEPPRVATVVLYRDRRDDRTVCLVDYHLVYGVQAGGRYREDRPLLVDRHRAEVHRLQRLVDEHLALGHAVYAVGDSNFHGLRLTGLRSAWEDRDRQPGTLGPRRQVDDVLGPGHAVSVTLLSTASDHAAVVVTCDP